MYPKEIFIRSLLTQYRVFRQELITFTVLFIFSMLMIGSAWIVNHIVHQLWMGRALAIFGLLIGLSMATHCGNTLQSLRQISTQVNQTMQGEYSSFAYDLDQANTKVRMVVTGLAKAIGVLFLLWCFTPWPKL